MSLTESISRAAASKKQAQIDQSNRIREAEINKKIEFSRREREKLLGKFKTEFDAGFSLFQIAMGVFTQLLHENQGDDKYQMRYYFDPDGLAKARVVLRTGLWYESELADTVCIEKGVVASAVLRDKTPGDSYRLTQEDDFLQRKIVQVPGFLGFFKFDEVIIPRGLHINGTLVETTKEVIDQIVDAEAQRTELPRYSNNLGSLVRTIK